MENKEKQTTEDAKEVKKNDAVKENGMETKEKKSSEKEKKASEGAADTKPAPAGIPVGAFVIMLVFVLLVGVIVGYVISQNGNSDKGKQQDKKSESKEDTKPYSGNPEDYVTLGEYTGIQVLVTPTDEDVQSAIDEVIDDKTEPEKLEGTVKDGDMVHCSFVATVDGKPYSDGTGEDDVVIGSSEWIPGFEEGITGMKTGTTKELKLTFPQKYDDESVAGKAVTFLVEAKYICGEEVVPEYNDKFVQSISDYKNTAEYEEHLKKQLRQDNEDSKAELAWEQVVANATVNAYPSDMVELSAKLIRQGYEDMAEMGETTIEDIMAQWDMTEEDFATMAEEEVGEFLIALAIAKRENIELSDSEYQSTLEEEYTYYEEGYDSIEAFEKEMGDYVRYEATVNKVTEWVGDAADIAD